MQPTSQQTTSRPVPAPPSYSSEYSQFPRPVLPAQSAAPAAESKTNPFTAEYRDPYAATPTLDRPRSRESLDVPRPPSESSNRSRSPSPVPDPEHARNERYASEFEAQRRVWEGGKREAGQVEGAPQIKTIEGETIKFVVLPNGVLQVPTTNGWITTKIGRRSGLVTVLSAGTLLLVAWPLAWLPFVFKKTGKDYVHKCPVCEADLAVIPRHLV